MKRMVAIFLVVALMSISVFAYADDFTIHSGVKFGMTMDEVVETEKAAGFTAEKEDIDEYEKYHCSAKHDSKVLSLNGQVAGVKGANITYHFTKDGKLDAAVYGLTTSDSSGKYDPIRTSLIKKYGDPDTSMSEVWHTLLKPDIYGWPDYCLENYNVESINFKCTIDYVYNDSWLVPQDDGSYVLIVGIEFRQYVTKSGTFYMSMVGYQHFTKKEIEEAQNTVTDELNTYVNQLENDL